ncbi:ATP-binding protein [Kitasatospora sp. NBC_00085]|uniref:ATP-binding protein n=1 Tax=unclassified Kitasatospora TaxID=2633591 RepID=UPI002F9077E3
MPPAADQRSLALVSGRGAVTRSREFTRAALFDWGWLPAAGDERRAVAEDVLLVVSELVTNAARHAGGPIELRLRHSPSGLRVEVSDESPEPPVLRSNDDPAVPGRHGLRVVALLSWAWGSVPDAGGKTVWSEIAAPPARLGPATGRDPH